MWFHVCHRKTEITDFGNFGKFREPETMARVHILFNERINMTHLTSDMTEVQLLRIDKWFTKGKNTFSTHLTSI